MMPIKEGLRQRNRIYFLGSVRWINFGSSLASIIHAFASAWLLQLQPKLRLLLHTYRTSVDCSRHSNHDSTLLPYIQYSLLLIEEWYFALADQQRDSLQLERYQGLIGVARPRPYTFLPFSRPLQRVALSRTRILLVSNVQDRWKMCRFHLHYWLTIQVLRSAKLPPNRTTRSPSNNQIVTLRHWESVQDIAAS